MIMHNIQKIVYILFIICICLFRSVGTYAYSFDNQTGRLPSEQTKEEINNMSGVPFNDGIPETRDGPPGSGTGGGGAVGVILGDTPYISLLVVILCYIVLKRKGGLKSRRMQ